MTVRKTNFNFEFEFDVDGHQLRASAVLIAVFSNAPHFRGSPFLQRTSQHRDEWLILHSLVLQELPVSQSMEYTGALYLLPLVESLLFS